MKKQLLALAITAGLAFSANAETLGQQIDTAINDITQSGKTLIDNTKNAVDDMASKSQAVLSNIGEKIDKTADMVKSETKETVEKVTQKISDKEDNSFKKELIKSIILDDDLSFLLFSKIAVEQSQSIPVMQAHLTEFVAEKPSDKPYQLVGFVDFHCDYCRAALTQSFFSLDQSLPQDIELSTFAMLNADSPVAMQYAAFGLEKVSKEKFQEYVKAMYAETIDNGAKATAEEMQAKLASFGIEVKAPELEEFVKNRITETFRAYEVLRLNGTPTFAFYQTKDMSKMQVFLGNQLEYLDLYKQKIEGVK